MLISIIFFVLLLALLGVITVAVNKQITGFGAPISSTISVSDNEGVLANPNVIAAQPGTLTTHTTNTSGTITMTNSSHGITTGQRVDLYWSGGQCYGAVVGTVSGTTVPIASVSGGSNLPSSSTAITVGIATSVTFEVTGNNVQGLYVSSPQFGYVVFNNGSTDVYAVLVGTGGLVDWSLNSGPANPLAGVTPTIAYFSHNLTTSQVTGMQALAVTH